jgi:hypothetical protein
MVLLCKQAAVAYSGVESFREVFVMSKKYTAQCICGAVKFAFDRDPDFVANCHSLEPKAHRYIGDSGKTLDRNFCPECGSRIFSSNLESFPGLVFVMLDSLDRPEVIAPKLEMFTRRRLKWNKPLDLPQFDGMPS